MPHSSDAVALMNATYKLSEQTAGYAVQFSEAIKMAGVSEATARELLNHLAPRLLIQPSPDTIAMTEAGVENVRIRDNREAGPTF